MAREPVVGNRLPHRRIVGELALVGTDAGVAVDGAQPYSDLPLGLGVAAEQGRAAVGAEALLGAAAARIPTLDQVLALRETERAFGRARVRRCTGSGAALTARAVAVVRRDERLADLVADAPAYAASGDDGCHDRKATRARSTHRGTDARVAVGNTSRRCARHGDPLLWFRAGSHAAAP